MELIVADFPLYEELEIGVHQLQDALKVVT